MPAGFRVINDDNTLQIDQDFKTLFLKEKRLIQWTGTAPLIAGSPKATGLNVSFQGSENAVLVLRPFATDNADGTNPFGIGIYQTHYASGTWNYRLVSNVNANNPAYMVYLYFFDVEPVNTENYGLRVFDAQGKITFDSSAKPLKIANRFYGKQVSGFLTAKCGETDYRVKDPIQWYVLLTVEALAFPNAPVLQPNIHFAEYAKEQSSVQGPGGDYSREKIYENKGEYLWVDISTY